MVDRQERGAGHLPPPQTVVLTGRADALEIEARAVLDALRLEALLSALGPVEIMGSFVSGLMTHREIDVATRVGPDAGTGLALELAAEFARRHECRRVLVTDERAERSPAEVRDERIHLEVDLLVGGAVWTLDISLFLHDEHANVTGWHRDLRASLTPEQRDAILAIKTALREGPSYPGGLAVYTAVLEHGVTSLEEFRQLQGVAFRS